MMKKWNRAIMLFLCATLGAFVSIASQAEVQDQTSETSGAASIECKAAKAPIRNRKHQQLPVNDSRDSFNVSNEIYIYGCCKGCNDSMPDVSMPAVSTLPTPHVAKTTIEGESDEKAHPWLDFFSKLISSVAWPACILLVIYLFREKVGRLVDRIDELKYKDLVAKFNKGLEAAEESAAALPSEAAIVEDVQVEKAINEYERLSRIAEISPRAAIIEAWVELEDAVREAARAADISVRGAPNLPFMVKSLILQERLQPRVMPLFDKLRILRNEASHIPEFALSKDEAIKYAGLTLDLAKTFRAAG